ncbi:MAG: XdhC family protein [Bacteroidales bacterium]
MRNICQLIGKEQNCPGSLALATIISSEGSTPQKPGNSALFSEKGRIYGTVGGGILEKRVEESALELLKTKEAGLFSFDLDHDISEKYEAICGGKTIVLVDGDPCRSSEVFTFGTDLIKRRQPFVIGTFCNEVDGRITVSRSILTRGHESTSKWTNEVVLASDRLLEERNPGNCTYLETVNVPGKKEVVFLEAIKPRERLFIAGAGHIGQALCHYASRLDFEVTVADDRIDYANKANLPEADNILCGDIAGSLAGFPKDKSTFVVIVTRGHKDDAEVLKKCIGSGAAYIGMIGSRMKVARMKEDFIINGWTDEKTWSTIFAPVGIAIGSKTVDEIAVSIAAQLVQVRNSAR